MKALFPQHSIESAPTGLSAQNWTSDEQALIAAIELCWDQTANEQLTPNDVVSWTLLSQDFRPIHVKVSSDFGFICFHSIRLWESADGTRETNRGEDSRFGSARRGGGHFTGKREPPRCDEPSPPKELGDPAV